MSQKQEVVQQCPFTRLLSPLFLNTPLTPSSQDVTSCESVVEKYFKNIYVYQKYKSCCVIALISELAKVDIGLWRWTIEFMVQKKNQLKPTKSYLLFLKFKVAEIVNKTHTHTNWAESAQSYGQICCGYLPRLNGFV